jgi:hypothetical protein
MSIVTQSIGQYQSWTPTFTGFSVDPTALELRYSLNGKMCNVQVIAGSGVSNATTFTMTLPFAAKTGSRARAFALATDSGANNSGWVSTRSGSNILDVFKTAATTTFTASGGKGVSFFLTYEID